VSPIPESARPTDFAWEIEFQALARGLVSNRAKSRVIERLTFLSHKSVARVYRELFNEPPPSGPVFQGSAQFYSSPDNYGRALHGAVFLRCYQRLAQLLEAPANHGWMLLHAYRSYLALTQRAPAGKRLDINQAYCLLTHTGFASLPKAAELQLVTCALCHTSYLVAAAAEPDTQGCPMCAINANFKRLASQCRTVRRANNRTIVAQ
jgi:hypothetical protein